MNLSNYITKKNLIRFIIFIVCLWLLTVLYGFLTSGTTVINADTSENAITITDMKGKKIASGYGSISVHLRQGSYIVHVQRKNAQALQYFTVNPRKTTRYHINPKDTENLEPVLNANAGDISVGDHLFYLNPVDEALYKVDSQNNTILVDEDRLLRSVQWINSSSGIGQDYTKHLYSVTLAGIERLSLPVPVVDNYSVAPNGKVYISYNKTVYVGSIEGNFKKLYVADKPFTTLAAYDGGLAIINNVSSDDTNSDTTPYILLLDGTKKPPQATFSISGQTVWSPGGKYVAASTGSNYKIYDRQLKSVATIPNTKVSNPAWIDDTSLVFTVNNDLWRYNVTSQQSELLASDSAATTTTDVAISDDNGYAYVVVTNLDNSSSIMRAGLKNRSATPDIVTKLNDLFPMTTNGYTMTLVNFAAPPSVVVEPASAATAQSNLQQAAQQVQSFGFDTSGLRFQVSEPSAHH